MKTIAIIATENIRVDTHDVVAGDILAEVRSDHPLLTLAQMVQMGQATINAASTQADFPHIMPAPSPGTTEPAAADASIVGDRPLTDFPQLDVKLREYLAAATPPITTLREATAYLAANGGHFRKLTNIGTAADKQIKAALGL